jgi:GNAT superfamily N-acetyltransferase
MPYNAPYYGNLLESAGLRVVKRLNAWDIFSDRVPGEVLDDADFVGAGLAARGFTLRPVDFGHFRRDVSRLRPVYSEAMAGSWGHTPLSEAEFMDQARGLRFICPPEFIQVAEHEGRVAGFMGVAPDLNQVLRRVARGRLLPLGWARLLAGRRKILWGRIVMYGVLPQYRGTGLAVWLYATIIRALFARGYAGAEASYVLEDNRPVNDISLRVGGTLGKRYAIYGLPADGEDDDVPVD